MDEKWEREKRGSIIGAWGDTLGRLTHILFADDTTLVAKSKRDLIVMLNDIQDAFAAAGVTLNVSKCMIQTNAHTNRTPPFIDVNGMQYPVVPPTIGFKVLGTRFTLSGGIAAEFDAKIAAAWSKFH